LKDINQKELVSFNVEKYNAFLNYELFGKLEEEPSEENPSPDRDVVDQVY